MTFPCLWPKALRDMDAGKLILLFMAALATRSSKSCRSLKRLRCNLEDILGHGLSRAFLSRVLLQISLNHFAHLQQIFIYLDALKPLQFLCEFQIRYLAAR